MFPGPLCIPSISTTRYTAMDTLQKRFLDVTHFLIFRFFHNCVRIVLFQKVTDAAVNNSGIDGQKTVMIMMAMRTCTNTDQNSLPQTAFLHSWSICIMGNITDDNRISLDKLLSLPCSQYSSGKKESSALPTSSSLLVLSNRVNPERLTVHCLEYMLSRLLNAYSLLAGQHF